MTNARPERIKKNLLIKILLIVAAVYSSLIATEAAIQVQGGYITQIDFAGTSNTERWLGFHGEITANTITIGNSRLRKNDSIQKIFMDISVHEDDYLLIMTSPSPPVLSGLRAGNIASIDGITGKGIDSGSNTFTYLSTYRIPYTGALLEQVPTLYMFERRFREGLLEDANGNLVLAVPLNGFQGEKNNFSFMLPDNDNNNLTYSIFYLPSQEDIHME